MKNSTDFNKLVDLFKSLTGAKSMRQVFDDCVGMYALSIQNVFTTEDVFIQNEKKYKEYAENYSKDELVIIKNILSES